MKSSFIIGFHTARIDNLLQTLWFLSEWHTDVITNCELITVCQDKLDTPIVTSKWGKHQHFDLELSEMSLPYVTNFGIDKSSSDKLIILESDRILPENYFSSIIDQLEEGVQITTRTMKKLKNECKIQEIESGKFEFDLEYRSDNVHEFGVRNMWSGNTALMKSDFYKAGKMDEEYIGYGWADSDMCLTMDKIGVKSVYREEIELHLWHPPMTYGEQDQKKLFIDNGIKLCKKWDKPIPQILRQDMLAYRTDNII
jgi:hypothetical protein